MESKAAGPAAPSLPGLTDPLSEDDLMELSLLPQDVLPEERRQTAHYIRGNEGNLALFSTHIAGLGGAYVGIGSDQNFTLAHLAGAERLFVFDYDIVVVRVMRVHVALLKHCDSLAHLLELWGNPDLRDQVAACLSREYPSGTEVDALIRIHRRYGKAIRKHLESSRSSAEKGRTVHWTGKDDSFQYVQSMARRGAVRVLEGDLLAGKCLAGIGAYLHGRGIPLRVLYLSNAEEYWSRYTPDLENSLLSLPHDVRSVILRTIHDTNLPKCAPKNYYHYNIQKVSALVRYVTSEKRPIRFRSMVRKPRLDRQTCLSFLE
jgi:hypothetical protein